MTLSIFQHAVNNFNRTLAAPHVIADGALVLSAGSGALLGSLAAYEVYRVTVLNNVGLSNESVAGIVEATTLATDTLSGLTWVEGFSDAAYASGLGVQVRPTAKTFSNLQAAINAFQQIAEVSVAAGVTLDASHYGKWHLCSGTSADYTVVLPTAVGFAGQTISFRMSPALTKRVTLQGGSGQTINGLNTRVMYTSTGSGGEVIGETAILESDGANWQKLTGVSRAVSARMRLTGTATSFAANTPTQVLLDTIDYDNTGITASVSGNQIVIPRAGLYRTFHQVPLASESGAIGVFSLVQQTTPGSYVAKDARNFVTTQLATAQGTYDILCAAGDTLQLVGYTVSGTGTTSNAAYPSYDSPQLEVSELNPW